MELLQTSVLLITNYQLPITLNTLEVGCRGQECLPLSILYLLIHVADQMKKCLPIGKWDKIRGTSQSLRKVLKKAREPKPFSSLSNLRALTGAGAGCLGSRLIFRVFWGCELEGGCWGSAEVGNKEKDSG